LAAFHHRKQKRKLTLELDYELSENLKQYGGFYREHFGGEVNPAELMLEIVRQFMAQDEEFEKHRSRGRSREPKTVVASGAA
jgi:hypothetical protein